MAQWSRVIPLGHISLCGTYVLVALLIVIGCAEREQLPLLTEPTNARQFVTDAAAQHLDSNGFFRLTGPEVGAGLIDADRAIAIAVAAVRTYGPTMKTYLERQHGAPIDFISLQADSRAYFGRSPYVYEALGAVHPGLQKGYGPSYFVTLRSNTKPVLSVAVSALNGDATIDTKGRLGFGVKHGNDFIIQGIGLRHADGMPVSPEHAARIASQTFAARVVAVPELLLPAHRFAPQYARWRLTLDRPVTARRSGGAPIELQTLYVGLGGDMYVPANEQPGAMRDIEPDTRKELAVERRADVPTAFDRITR
jgi:hypothetical protein